MKTYFLVDFDSTIMYKSDSFFDDISNMLLGEFAETFLNPPKDAEVKEYSDFFIFQTNHKILKKDAIRLYFDFKKSDVGVKLFELIKQQDNFFLDELIGEIENFLSSKDNLDEDVKFWYMEQVLSFFRALYTVIYHKRDIVDSFLRFYRLAYIKNNKILINTLQSQKDIGWIVEVMSKIDPIKYSFLQHIQLYGGSMISSKRDSNRVAYILYNEKVLNDVNTKVVVVGDSLMDAKNYSELTKYKNPNDFILSFPQKTELLIDREKCEKFFEDAVAYLPMEKIDRIKRSYQLQIDYEDSGRETESKYGLFGGHFDTIIEKGLI
ncbi:MAG: hypothetical protein LBC92_04905 [Rickettsiales bacterium]|jgi:hypothetical protein|nr:hypothetical protein [Rickettsiales bacterium]